MQHSQATGFFQKVYRLDVASLRLSINNLYDEGCVDFAGCAAALLHSLGSLGSMVWLHRNSRITGHG